MLMNHKIFDFTQISDKSHDFLKKTIFVTFHSWTPPLTPSPLIKGGQDLPKIESLGGGGRGLYKYFCQKRDKPEKGGLMGGEGGGRLPLFYYFTVPSHLLCVGKSKIPFIIFRIFGLLSYPFKILIHVFIVLKPGIICTFLIHSGSLQKMLTALFNLV